MLNADSDAIVVIGMLNKSLAIKAKSEKHWLLFFDHSNTYIFSKKNQNQNLAYSNKCKVVSFQLD